MPTPLVSWEGTRLFDSISSNKSQVPAIMLMSSCGSSDGRLAYAQQLMEHLPVDSYGSCLHNKDSSWYDVDMIGLLACTPHTNTRAHPTARVYLTPLSPVSRPNDYRSTERHAHALELMRHYKFAATFETSERNDTVSEQFFMALEAGAVPST